MKERKREDEQMPHFPPAHLPNYDAPVGDPPVPNRAFTEMRLDNGIDILNEPEKAQIFRNDTQA